MVGTRFDYHYSPYGQKAGISLFPVCGVVSGVKLSLTGSGYTAGTGNALVTISAGSIKLDGNTISFPDTNATVATEAADLSADTITVPIYLNPTRLVKALTATPAVGAEGDKYIKVVQVDDYYVADQIYKVAAGAWAPIDPYADIPVTQSHNMFPLNDIVTTGYGADNISATPELPVFHKTGVPPHVNAPGNAMLRQTATIMLGEITYSGGVATITKDMPDYYILSV